MKINKVDTARCKVGEGPLWDQAEQALYFVDILGPKVHRYDPATGTTQSWEAPDKIGSMALREQGGAILALPNGIHTLDFDSGKVEPLAIVDGDPRVQFNDGKVDRAGRFIVGSTDSQITNCLPLGSVYSLSADAKLTVIDEGIHMSNGPCWSPDNKTFYFSDSYPHKIYAYDYDIATGAVANKREFADTRELGGIPDGATVDADGLMWMAICEGQKVVAFRPDGKVERTIDMPEKLIASVMFGGPNLDELYVTTLDPAALGRDQTDGGGCTFVIEGLGAKGIVEPRFAG